MVKRLNLKSLIGLVLALFVPKAAWACPVCFGASDSPAAQATNLAVLVMLGFVLFVLTGFATFFVYLIRRARMQRERETDWSDDIVSSRA